MEDQIWHTFKYVIDMDGEKWDLFYDDEKVESNIQFRGNTGKALDTLLIMNFVNGGATFKAYFSEIIIYEGTERPLSVDKKSKLATLWGTLKTTPQWVAPHHGIRDL